MDPSVSIKIAKILNRKAVLRKNIFKKKVSAKASGGMIIIGRNIQQHEQEIDENRIV